MTYIHFNKLRLKALSLISISSSNKKDKIKELEAENNNLKINNLTLNKIIYDLKSTISHLALSTDNKYIIDEINKKLKYFEKLLSSTNEIIYHEE